MLMSFSPSITCPPSIQNIILFTSQRISVDHSSSKRERSNDEILVYYLQRGICFGRPEVKRMGEHVKLLGHWASPSALRVEWALKLKGIEYEYIQEDLLDKSDRLLQSNPVYKKVPVLVHNGKPVPESLLIVEYIDEVWPENPLLPTDHLERAKARFWAKFVDDKCVPPFQRILAAEGEQKEKEKKEVQENLKILETGLEGKTLFGGETIGYIDIAAGWLGIWARVIGEIVDVELIDAETMPLLDAWFDMFLELPIIKECLPSYEKLFEFNKNVHEILTNRGSSS